MLMKSKLYARLTAVGCALFFSMGAVKADIVNFDVQIAFQSPSPGNITGTLAIDVTNGVIVSGDIAPLPGFSTDLTHILNSVPDGGWLVDLGATNSYTGVFIELVFTT
jgi:hypothetical protein